MFESLVISEMQSKELDGQKGESWIMPSPSEDVGQRVFCALME